MKRALVLLAVTSTAWIDWDLSHSASESLWDFDPVVVSRLETAMWRSYYEHRSVALYRDLVRTLREEDHLTFWSANLAAYRAAKAAVVFQRGTARADYEKALPDLTRYYGEIRRFSANPFDVRRAAELELEWWIVHRQRTLHAAGDLERALADLQAEIYRQPSEGFLPHAKARAEAMRIRDNSAAGVGTTEADWRKIDTLLRESWTTLKREVARTNKSRL